MANTFTVTNLNDRGAGSLRRNLYLAHTTPGADIITFDPSLKGQTIALTTGTLNIGSDLTLDGDLDNDGAPDITIEANQQFRVFNVDDGNGIADKTVVFDGLTITGGRTENRDSFGAGIRGLENLTVRNSVITNNTTANSTGGGIHNGGGDLTIQNSTISGNLARFGGGIYNSQGAVTLSHSTLSDNSADGYGGGIDNRRGAVTLSNSTLSDNSARFGGGILNYFGTLSVSSSTLSDNSAGSHGGGILNYYGALTVSNSTLSSNSAGRLGGGIADGSGDGQTILTSTIVAGNTAGEGAADIASLSYEQSNYTSGGNNRLGIIDVGGFTDRVNGDRVGVTPTGYVDSDGNLAGSVFNAGQAYTGNMASSTDGTNNPDDVLFGTDGDDNIWAGTRGNDTIVAGAGNDNIGFGAGDAWVDAGAGDDIVYAAGNGDWGDNIFHLGEGDNRIHLEGGNNTITAGTGDDSIGLGTGTDIVNAGDGNNTVYMAKPNAPAGDKDIVTGMGNDWVQTGSGDDRLNLGTNAGGDGDFDRAYGGGGSDIFVLNPGSGWLVVGDFTRGEDQLELQGMTFADVQQTIGSGHTQIWAGDDLLAELQSFTGTLSANDFVTASVNP